MKGVTYSCKMFYNIDPGTLELFCSFSCILLLSQSHRYRKSLNRLLKVCYVLATSAGLKRLTFFFFFCLLWPLTVLMMQTRQAVRAIKQSILLRCLWLQCFQHIIFLINQAPGLGLEQREFEMAVLYLQIIIILISYMIIQLSE